MYTVINCHFIVIMKLPGCKSIAVHGKNIIYFVYSLIFMRNWEYMKYNMPMLFA